MPLKSYRVCIIVPPGYKHSLCFVEVGFLLKHSLVSCGKECDIAINDFARDRINIILGWHLLAFKPEHASYTYIPYQLEQLGTDAWSAFSSRGHCNVAPCKRCMGLFRGKRRVPCKKGHSRPPPADRFSSET